GLEPATLCLGIRSGRGPSPSTHVRQCLFDCLATNPGSPDIRHCPAVSIRLTTVWLQCLAPLLRSVNNCLRVRGGAADTDKRGTPRQGISGSRRGSVRCAERGLENQSKGTTATSDPTGSHSNLGSTREHQK